MEHARNLELLRLEIESCAGLLRSADLTTAVPTCPSWDLAQLTRHTGGAHRWARHIVADRLTEFVHPKTVATDTPGEPEHLAAWFAAGADPLLSALDSDPDIEVWGFSPPGSIGFWARRMLHETVVHRADVELALGREPEVSTEVGLDGIAELLELLAISKAPARLAELGRPGDSVHLHATDGAGEWTVTLTDSGFVEETGHRKATAAVRGRAGDLYLLLWNRGSAQDARFETFGDLGLLDAWLAATAI